MKQGHDSGPLTELMCPLVLLDEVGEMRPAVGAAVFNLLGGRIVPCRLGRRHDTM